MRRHDVHFRNLFLENLHVLDVHLPVTSLVEAFVWLGRVLGPDHRRVGRKPSHLLVQHHLEPVAAAQQEQQHEYSPENTEGSQEASGFVAGDAALLKPYLQYRTYHGAAMPVQHQLASIAAWNDETHVEENRQQYRTKFDLFQSELGHLLPLQKPDAGFYYWLKVDNDEAFAKMLMEKTHIKVLPGRYLSRDTEQGNPGENHVRMALVADLAQCEEVVKRLKAIL